MNIAKLVRSIRRTRSTQEPGRDWQERKSRRGAQLLIYQIAVAVNKLVKYSKIFIFIFIRFAVFILYIYIYLFLFFLIIDIDKCLHQYFALICFVFSFNFRSFVRRFYLFIMLILTKFNKNLIIKINKLFYYLTNKVTKILTLIIKLDENSSEIDSFEL